MNILVNSIITILYKLRDKFNLLIDKDFMFTFQRLKSLNFENDIFSYIVDVYISVMQVRNINLLTIYIFKNSKISVIQKYKKEKCYLTSEENVHFVANFKFHKSTTSNFFKRFLKIEIVVAVVEVATFAIYQRIIKSTIVVVNIIIELVTFADITIYDKSLIVQQ